MPVDRLIDELQATVSLGVREICCRLGLCGGNFDRAAENLKRAAGIVLSGEKLRQVVEEEGRAVLAAHDSEQLEFDWSATDCKTTAGLQEGQAPVSRVYLGSDGVKVPLVTESEKQKRRKAVRAKRQQRGRRCRPLPRVKTGADQAYKEFKLVTFYDQDQLHRHVAVTRKDHRSAGKLMRRDAARLLLRTAQQKVANIDGAEWIANQIRTQKLPLDAVGLDFYHLAENLHKGRRATFGEDSAEGSAWAEDLLHTVKHEGYEPFWEKLLAWRSRWRNRAKRKAADQLLNYVCERREMIRYPEFLAKGWQIGSGPTEAMCKATTLRLKGVGMRWDAANAEAMMALESLEQSHQWDLYWRKCARTAA